MCMDISKKRFTGIRFTVNENIDSEDYKRFQGSCTSLVKKPELADFVIKISNDVHFILKTHHLIKYGKNDRCTVLIECPGYVTPRHEESEESDVMDDHTQVENQNEPWVLGSPYFKAFPFIIDNTGAEVTYHFVG